MRLMAAVVATLMLADALVAVVPAPSEATGPTGSSVPVMIILDASGSMTADDAPGPRIDAAKQAIVALVEALPDGSPVGLLVYGTGTGSTDAERDAGCQDVRQLVPVGPVDKPAVIAAVRDVAASGYTPMGAALQKAADELPPTGAASIVLVSDGIDTCSPPSTCEVASTLKSDHPDLAIHTVGFKDDAAARAELTCVADAGGGSYRPASDGPALTAVLQSQVDAALRPYLVSGMPVIGTPTRDGAPRIAPGQYWDNLSTDAAATRHYSIELTQDETVHVAGTVIPPALRGGGTDEKLGVVAQLQDGQGNLCLPTQREGDALLAGKVDPVTALISGVVGGPKWSKRCPDEGVFVVVVQRVNPSTVPTHLELVVLIEQPVVGSPIPGVDPPEGLTPPLAVADQPATGGASFTTAPLLIDGTWSDTLSTGETRYYKVRLDWGQRLTYQVDVDPVEGVQHGAGHVRSAVATPLRQELPLSSTGNPAREFGGEEAVSLTGSTLVAVQYGNRESDRSDIRSYSLAGDHYLSVGMSYPVDALPFRTTVRISIQVVGHSGPGPTYAATPTPSQTIRSTGTLPAGASAGSVLAAPTPDPTAPTEPSDRPAWMPGVTAGAVVLIIAALGVALIMIVRRRARSGQIASQGTHGSAE